MRDGVIITLGGLLLIVFFTILILWAERHDVANLKQQFESNKAGCAQMHGKAIMSYSNRAEMWYVKECSVGN